MSDLRTPLNRARGLGSAKDGVGHWISQRATAVALIPLVIWFGASMVAFAGADYETMIGYLRQPYVGILMTLLIFAAFYHMRLGLQVVIEDYITKEGSRILLILLTNFLVFAVGFACVFAMLSISFGGA